MNRVASADYTGIVQALRLILLDVVCAANNDDAVTDIKFEGRKIKSDEYAQTARVGRWELQLTLRDVRSLGEEDPMKALGSK